MFFNQKVATNLVIVSSCSTICLLRPEMDAQKTRQRPQVSELLECFVCCEPMLGSTCTCEAAHTLCTHCGMKLVKCPLCETNILPRRNLLFEQQVKQYVADPVKFCNFINSGGSVENPKRGRGRPRKH